MAQIQTSNEDATSQLQLPQAPPLPNEDATSDLQPPPPPSLPNEDATSDLQPPPPPSLPNEDATSHLQLPPPLPLPNRRRMPRVPEMLLREGKNSQYYIPEVVSIGPYHHGNRKLRLVESFKPKALEMVLSDNKDKQIYYYEVIKHRITDIRDCYEEHPTNSYSDDKLARMMLLDACFIIIVIRTQWFEYFDRLTAKTALRDMLLLENQIPFWIVKLLLRHNYDEEESQQLINRFWTETILGEYWSKRSLPFHDEEELHFLETLHRFYIFDCFDQSKKTRPSFINCGLFSCFRAEKKTVDPGINNANPTTDLESTVPFQGRSRFLYRACKRLFKKDNEGDHSKTDRKEYMISFRSVTDLKAKGIHIGPSPTHSVKDVQFESNFIYGKLQLPIQFVSPNRKFLFRNMIAYELNRNDHNYECVMISYINLMKSLIVRPEDVKELREKRILFYSSLESDEQVVEIYRDINTYGENNPMIYADVTNKIHAHYNSRSKTWIAELIHTYFRTPWTIITLVAATCLLVLTFLQTIYTMKH